MFASKTREICWPRSQGGSPNSSRLEELPGVGCRTGGNRCWGEGENLVGLKVLPWFWWPSAPSSFFLGFGLSPQTLKGVFSQPVLFK